jgi:GTP pyrophosphokinase
MHFYNEFGPASHVAYKKSHQKDSSPTDQFQWIKEVHKSGIVEDEPIKAKLFKDQIFAFTPDKDIVQLPKGSTPLDFAYKVHTRVGNQCIGALVNGKATALDTEIKTGDIVDIRTDKNKQYASEDWVNMVHTEAAKRKIKSSLAHKRRSLL